MFYSPSPQDPDSDPRKIAIGAALGLVGFLLVVTVISLIAA